MADIHAYTVQEALNTTVGGEWTVASAGTAGSYLINVNSVAAGSFKITVANVSAGSLSEAIVITFVGLKGASS